MLPVSVLLLNNAKIGIIVSEVWNSSFWFPFIGGTSPTRDWCSVLLVDFRGTDSPPCDTKTGPDSRWRLQYDVYQYFLPENDLTEEGLLKHLQRMAEVPQVTASAIKVNLILVIWELSRGEATRSLFLYCSRHLSGIPTLLSLILLLSWESLLVITQCNVGF